MQADALHARHDETQRQLRACAPASRHTSAPTSNATPEQLRKRKAAAIEEYDAKIKRTADEASELRKLTPAELRARLAGPLTGPDRKSPPHARLLLRKS